MHFFATMWTSVLTLLMMGTVTWSQMAPMCASPTSESAPACTLTFRPFMAPQIGPTCTIYQAIVTTFLDIVDCRQCTITNIEETPTPRGPFTAELTSPILTVTRVGCMPETTEITRGVFRAYGKAGHIKPRNVAEEKKELRAPTNLRRSILKLVEKISNADTPDDGQLTVKAYNLITQLNSAVFAITLISSGFNLTTTCQEIRDPSIQLQLSQASLNAQQIGDIVCFASVYGIDLNTSTAELLQDLEAAIYAIEVGSDFPNNNSRLCDILDLSFGPYLGIDVDAIYQFICGTGFTTITATTSFANTTESTLAPFVTGTAGTAGTAGTIGSIGAMPTGEAGPYANSTTAVGTAVGTGFGTGVTSGDGGIGFSNDALNNGHLPPSPTASPYYPVWVTSTSSVVDFKQY